MHLGGMIGGWAGRLPRLVRPRLGAAGLALGAACLAATVAPHAAQAYWVRGVWIGGPVVLPPPVYVAPPVVVAGPPPYYYGRYPRRRFWAPGYWRGPYWVPGRWAWR